MRREPVASFLLATPHSHQYTNFPETVFAPASPTSVSYAQLANVSTELGRSSHSYMTPPPADTFQEEIREADVVIWKEALFAADLLLLHSSPVYYGLGVPRGDGSAVVLVPGFLGTDAYLRQLHAWLGRIGYQPYFSGIGLNAECPNLLIQRRLRDNIDRALLDTGRKIHLIGHSLGGVIARAVACQRSDAVASVITLAAPFRGAVIHPTVLRAVESVRKRVLIEHGPRVLPTCYTGRCTCDFLSSLRRKLTCSVLQTAIYTRSDGITDWRYCTTGDPENDFEVTGTISVWHSMLPRIASLLSVWRLRAPQNDMHDSDNCPSCEPKR
jgi:triacylglycerol lipase